MPQVPVVIAELTLLVDRVVPSSLMEMPLPEIAAALVASVKA